MGREQRPMDDVCEMWEQGRDQIYVGSGVVGNGEMREGSEGADERSISSGIVREVMWAALIASDDIRSRFAYRAWTCFVESFAVVICYYNAIKRMR